MCFYLFLFAGLSLCSLQARAFPMVLPSAGSISTDVVYNDAHEKRVFPSVFCCKKLADKALFTRTADHSQTLRVCLSKGSNFFSQL